MQGTHLTFEPHFSFQNIREHSLFSEFFSGFFVLIFLLVAWLYWHSLAAFEKRGEPSIGFWKVSCGLYIVAFEKLHEHIRTLFKRRERSSRIFWKHKWGSKAKCVYTQYKNVNQVYSALPLSSNSNLVSLSL